MWRWWILAGLVVMALGVAACGDRTHDVGPCADRRSLQRSWESSVGWELSGDMGTVDDEFYRDLYRAFAPRLDVNVGETTKLTLSIRNRSDKTPTLTMRYHMPNVIFTITTPDCDPIWFSPKVKGVDRRTEVRFDPGEEKQYVSRGEWDFQVEGFGHKVPPGWYLAHALVGVYDETDEERIGLMVAYRRFYVGEAELFTARDEHPPAPVDPSACGGPVRRLEHVLREHDEHEGWIDSLRSRDNRFIYVTSAPLLDENRLSVSAYGIRVMVRAPLMDDWGLPDCVGELPVQVVVVEWTNRLW